jgi:pentatricopeptide repeat protein
MMMSQQQQLQLQQPNENIHNTDDEKHHDPMLYRVAWNMALTCLGRAGLGSVAEEWLDQMDQISGVDLLEQSWLEYG